MIGALRIPFFIGLALAIAFSGGIAATKIALDAEDPFDVLEIGPWVANPLAQTAGANPYDKARRALGDGSGLGQAEGLVFRATTDTSGAPLLASCAYLVAGQVPASRVWIMRLTGLSGEISHAEPPFSRALHSASVLRAPDGAFEIRLGAEARSGNWLFLSGNGPFGIEFLLFDTPAAGNFGLIDLEMPEIERQDCADA